MTHDTQGDALAKAERFLSEGDPRRAQAQLRASSALAGPHLPSADERLLELALRALEQDALELATEAKAHAVDASHPTHALVSELLALQPKIPAAYLRLFAEGTRTGLTHALRSQIDTLKRQNLEDAAEVFGQLGLRAPKLRKTYGVLMDPLLHGDGTPRKAPWHWGWLAAGMGVLTSLFVSLARLTPLSSSTVPASIDVEFAEGPDAMMSSAISLICSDRPERCDDARTLHASLDAHDCGGFEARLARLMVGDLDNASGDAIRLLQQRILHMCDGGANLHEGDTP